MLFNYSEIIVTDCLKDLMDKNPEQYQDLIMDKETYSKVVILTLNNVKPYYITKQTSKVYGEFDSKVAQKRADIFSTLTKSINEIRSTN